MDVELGSSGMAQDKSAEIITFNAAGEPPQTAAAETPERASDDGPSLEALGAGGFLAAMRHKAGLSVEETSAAIKVKPDHLEAIEWMRLDRLPPLPYAVGFVKAYARHLGLDAEAVAADFRSAAEAAVPVAQALPDVKNAYAPDSSEGGANIASVFAILAVVLFALWVGYQVLSGGAEEALAPVQRDALEATNVQAPEPDVPAVAAVEENLPDIIQPAVEAEGEAISSASDSGEATPSPSGVEETSSATIVEQAASEPVDPVSAPVTELAPEPTAQERPLPRRPLPAPLIETQPSVAEPVVIPAELTRSVAPTYPERCARNADDLESVTVMFDVSPDGRPVNRRVVSSSNACFESEALRTLTRWRFEPRRIDGAAAVENSKTATLNFRK